MKITKEWIFESANDGILHTIGLIIYGILLVAAICLCAYTYMPWKI